MQLLPGHENKIAFTFKRGPIVPNAMLPSSSAWTGRGLCTGHGYPHIYGGARPTHEEKERDSDVIISRASTNYCIQRAPPV